MKEGVTRCSGPDFDDAMPSWSSSLSVFAMIGNGLASWEGNSWSHAYYLLEVLWQIVSRL